jgi:hypothetical protein
MLVECTAQIDSGPGCVPRSRYTEYPKHAPGRKIPARALGGTKYNGSRRTIEYVGPLQARTHCAAHCKQEPHDSSQSRDTASQLHNLGL